MTSRSRSIDAIVFDVLLMGFGLAIVITVYRLRNTIQVDEIDLLKG